MHLPSDRVPSLEDAKQALRRALRKRRSEMAPQGSTLAREGPMQIAERLGEALRLAGVRCLASYIPFGDELDVRPIAAMVSSLGAVVCYPRVVSSCPPCLTFHLVPVGAVLVRGSLGIPEPGADLPLAPPIDALLVPGICFGLSGHRLGYGMGFYDRALREHPLALRIAPCYGFQLLDAVPFGDHDEPVDLIVTPSAAIWTRARPYDDAALKKEESL